MLNAIGRALAPLGIKVLMIEPLYSKDTLIQTATGKYHVGFDLTDHKDPAHNRDRTTNEFGKVKTLNIGAIPFELKFSRTFLAHCGVH